MQTEMEEMLPPKLTKNRKKNSYKLCTTLEKVEWICTVSLKLVK